MGKWFSVAKRKF